MFLPQFHNDPFNSAWWGEGFTEWTNVKSAAPMFLGHNQPRVPADGYFDLSDPAELVRQAKLARSHGIDAFTLYDYWYESARPLGGPVETILRTPDFDIDFSLCWANHSWTRSWTNRTGALDVLISQTYASSKSARAAHFDFLCRVFDDPRYVRISGRPLLQVYDSISLPSDYLLALKAHVLAKLGVEPHVDAFITSWRPTWHHLAHFDSATLFQPSAALFAPISMFSTKNMNTPLETRLRSAPLVLKRLIYLVQDALPDSIKRHSYAECWDRLISQFQESSLSSPVPLNPMAFVDFDNTPRYRGRARIMDGYDVGIFENGMKALLKSAENRSTIGYMFVNAWNEWGEGAYLQPDKNEGFSRLEAIENVKSRL
jgi:hypothetical protein